MIPQGNTTGSPVGKNPFDFANYQIGGSFANQSAEYLDGQPLNIGYINLPLLMPTQDSICGIQGAVQQPGAGVGQVLRRRDQSEHQVGNQYLARIRVRLSAQQGIQLERIFSNKGQQIRSASDE